MKGDDVQQRLDLRRGEIDLQEFAAALAVQHISHLIAYGGSEFNRPDWDITLHPQHLEAFLDRAVEEAKKTGRFVSEWLRLQRIFPAARSAWQKGQECFREHLARAETNQEEMENLSLVDFAVDCYAFVASHDAYPNNAAQQAWLVNGYMVAWRKHFLENQEGEGHGEGGL